MTKMKSTWGGFTLIEMMIALSISAIMLTAVGGLLTSVWLLAKASADEIQCTLKSCAIRNKLMHRLTNADGTLCGFGLLNATNIVCCAPGGKVVSATCKDQTWAADMADAKDCRFFHLDADKTWPERAGEPIQHIYLKIEEGAATYYERLIVPIFGKSPSKDEFVDGVGGRWQ